ncbi:Protein of unknown function (DUF3137) [Abditibacterium utsteinense]|uniref:DUF3137 domain-containing protein n=1 Tax=Abditibacterium utsteinense TaxID=1960156 RepID=A0A2S8SW96_9BACT|nr:DUF3137 domain-containing protein [Abditibacterium utsteinense]PQV65039.1 Protein of unknown function (DUF3137) [Abditibacterium utsteinense]
MASLSDENALHSRLAPLLQKMEERRQLHLKTCRLAALWCAGVGLLSCVLALGYSAQAGQVSPWSFLALVVAAGIYWVIASLEKSKYGSRFKQLILPPLVAQLGELTYRGEAGIGEEEFNLANLFENPDRFSGEDLIEGSIGATKIRMSEVEAERRETRRDSKGRTSTHYVTYFRGLFVIADFNKNLNSTTYVLPEGVTGSLGNFGAGLQSLGGKLSGRGELVRLEDPEFEANFKVFSSDQTDARYVLSSSLMRRFLDLKTHFGCEISAAFIGQSLFLAIDTRQNWFEAPPLSTPLVSASLDAGALGEVIAQLQSAIGIVETLDLNTRIWSKE